LKNKLKGTSWDSKHLQIFAKNFHISDYGQQKVLKRFEDGVPLKIKDNARHEH
jgi:hypothetical protein